MKDLETIKYRLEDLNREKAAYEKRYKQGWEEQNLPWVSLMKDNLVRVDIEIKAIEWVLDTDKP